MPDLSPTIDSILATVKSDFSGLSIEAIAEDTTAGISINTSATSMVQYWTNTLNVAVQYGTIYFEFNTSGIASADDIDTATLKIYVESIDNGGLDFYACRGFLASDGAIAAGDLPAYTRDASGATPDISDITKYSSKIDCSELSTSAFNNITLNSTALADMSSLDSFKIVIMGYDYDYADSAPPGTGNNLGITYSEYTGTTRDPKIVYVDSAAYSQDVGGVPAANISKINGIAIADISKVNGV